MISAEFTMWIASYTAVLCRNEGVNVNVKVREKEDVEYDHVSIKSEKILCSITLSPVMITEIMMSDY